MLEGLIVQLFTLRAKAKDIKALEKPWKGKPLKPLKEGELQQVIDSVQGFYDVLLEGPASPGVGETLPRVLGGAGRGHRCRTGCF